MPDTGRKPKSRLIRVDHLGRDGPSLASLRDMPASWSFDRRAHARFSHRHYIATAKASNTPAQRAYALAAAAIWRQHFARAA